MVNSINPFLGWIDHTNKKKFTPTTSYGVSRLVFFSDLTAVLNSSSCCPSPTPYHCPHTSRMNPVKGHVSYHLSRTFLAIEYFGN